MNAATAVESTVAPPEEQAESSAPPSPAGPVQADTPIRIPPGSSRPALLQTIRFGLWPMAYSLGARARYGDVWQVKLMSREEPFVITAHPDHVKSLFTARPQDAPSLTGESPLRPILGPNSVLTSVGERHMRQRKLLLPPFHGEAVQRYATMIKDVAEREIGRWSVGQQFALAPRMQAVTLEVIMRGIFGIEGTPARGSAEKRIWETIRLLLRGSTNPLYQLIELRQFKQREPRTPLRQLLGLVDRHIYALIRERRQDDTHSDANGRHDVLSLLLGARDEEGQLLTDQELRDELMSLVLAGHETTANSLAWTFERVLRNQASYDRLREVVRGGDREEIDPYIEATIYEGMRVRPVIPFIVRMVKCPWQLGEYVVPPRTPVGMSILAIHHREDVYTEPHAFRPERFLNRKPGTYTWIPFGGGIRRCLGASLAMAEQRLVLEAIVRRVDLAAPRSKPEAPRQRNVTMIPSRGGRVVVRAKRS